MRLRESLRLIGNHRKKSSSKGGPITPRNPKPLRAGPLPFETLGPWAFERLCFWLIQREGFEMVEYLGAAGTDQGRDIAARRGQHKWIFQCRNVRSFGPHAVQDELDKIFRCEGHERPDVLTFVVPCSISANARKVAQDRCRSAGIDCYFWAGTELDELIKNHSDILREFFQLEGRGQERTLRFAIPSILILVLLSLALGVAGQWKWSFLLLGVLALSVVPLIVWDFRSRRGADMLFTWRESSEAHTADHDRYDLNFTLANRTDSKICLNRVIFTLSAAFERISRPGPIPAMKISSFDQDVVVHLYLAGGKLELSGADASRELFSGYRLEFDPKEMLDFHICVSTKRPHDDELRTTIDLQMNFGIQIYYGRTTLEESVIRTGGSLGIGSQWGLFCKPSISDVSYVANSATEIKGPVFL